MKTVSEQQRINGIPSKHLWAGGGKTKGIVTALYPHFSDIQCFTEHYLKQMQINHIPVDTYNLCDHF
jgi:hypothetical protein